jgi:hypothetical protein
MSDDNSASSPPMKLLNNDNFSEWKASTEAALKEKRLWKHVADVNGDANNEDNAAAFGFIMRRIEHQQREHVAPGLNAHGAWKALCAAHEKQGPQAEVRYFQSLMSTRYVDGVKMEDHLSAMKEIFARLHAIGTELKERTRASLILATLPNSWSALSATLASAATDSNQLTVSTVSHALLQEQIRRANEARNTLQIESAAALLVAAGAKQSKQEKTPRKKCAWCLNLNHTEDECRGKAAGKPRRLPSDAVDAAAHIVSQPPTKGFVFAATGAPVDNDEWLLDCAASDHYCSQSAMFATLAPANGSVSVGDGRPLAITGTGSVHISTRVPGKADVPITVTGVSYVPAMTVNLLSVSRLVKAGLKVTFSGTPDQCIIRNGKMVIGIADMLVESKLWRLRTTPTQAATSANATSLSNTALLAAGEESSLPAAQLWHERMGHLHHDAVARLLNERMTADGPTAPLVSGGATAPHCEACVMGKQHRTAIPHTKGKRAARLLYRIHADVCGPFSTPSETGARYLLLLVDDYSRYKWHRCMAAKNEAFALIQQYVEASEAMHGHRVSVLRTDNGGEFVSNAFDLWLKQRG